jgi:formiminoglutamate deiminase
LKQVVAAELTWTGERFERGVQVHVSEGRIEAITNGAPAEAGAPWLLPRRALLPGFVSAHSHAFQRALRGRGESFPAGAGTFWSWREAMYSLVQQLDEDFYDVMRSTFEEMLTAGITTAGEFHYLHHSPERSDYGFDEIVLRAAYDAGIRLVLLMTCYKTGGIGQPLAPAQKRFETRDLGEFWRQVDALSAKLEPRTQSLGIAAHSIRGVPLEEIAPLYDETRRRRLPFHMHLEEQRKEIEECVKAYGRTPMQLINEKLGSAEGFTAVHATHSDPAEMKRFIDRGGRVCITPLTEANLGDGIADIRAIRPDRLSLGTDSNARISMIEEMRWLEYAQRLQSETRGVFPDGGKALLRFATAGGADALGVTTGRIQEGGWADFVAIDLDARSIADVPEENLLDAIVFGAGNEVISSTCVGGVWKMRR